MPRRSPRSRSALEEAIAITAPGTAVRRALDMIIAGHLGALICVGDTDTVLSAGNDGFPLNISFTANRLFELSKMDGAHRRGPRPHADPARELPSQPGPEPPHERDGHAPIALRRA